ncbi:MAG: HIT family protein [Chlamydiales bacterium]|nr:HIT family protein [Chlamydiales bacterium]
MRKKFSLIIVALCLIGGIYFLFIKPFSHSSFNGYCAFCDPAVLNNQKFYEDDLVFALYTHKPIFPGHCLVVSKRHVERFEGLTDAEITQIGRVIKKVDRAVAKVFGTSPYLLLEKNGHEVGQSVPHVHFHYVPRKSGDDSTIQFFAKMYMAHVKQPISESEMHETIEKLKKTIE